MLLWFISSLILSLSMSTMMTLSPLILGLWILFLALCISIITSLMLQSWFSFILFLIYIGGLLVMFAYFSALTPNQPLFMGLMITTLIITTIMFMSMSYKHMILNPSLSISNQSNLYSMTMLFTPSHSILMLMLASALFIALIAVVKVSSSYIGPLRPFKK